MSSGLSNVQQRDRKILGSGSKITKTHLNTFEDFCVHIQDLTPTNGGDFDSKLRAWDTSLRTLQAAHATHKDFSNKKDWVESSPGGKLNREKGLATLATIFSDRVTQERHTKCRLFQLQFPRLFPASRDIQPA